ncbi:hypothetical protein [Paramagnetospirillum magneticum]|uniref:Spermidine synthase n=1 Tax=Paramagnetospirillum magneticum (strain ATCC 700264 / AMB-1) TaxID=342108 RepID=Q2W9U6_PARM1|nr:hypothetical protein [Paramagnetospirillum magneticum]BAE49379.1 hypothetical protein amb0575 [Paramagnetospirillum magneticum AMB-1]
MSGCESLDGYEPEALAAAGVVIGGTDVPYPPMAVPRYKAVSGPNWALREMFLIAAPGYFSGPRQLNWMNAGLVRDGECWMSLTPGEIESQMPHLAAARGKVVVCGMGMGAMAYAVSARKAVERVVVVDRDPEVIAMFHQFAAFDTWPQRDKIDIVQADAREVRVDGVDFLYADIWPYYRMDCMVPDMQAIQGNIKAPRCGYWGQELDMVDRALSRGVAREDFSAAHVEAFIAETGLPLIGLEEPAYPELCRRASVNPAIGRNRRPMAEA